jgi:hypothetical protein
VLVSAALSDEGDGDDEGDGGDEGDDGASLGRILGNADLVGAVFIWIRIGQQNCAKNTLLGAARGATYEEKLWV